MQLAGSAQAGSKWTILDVVVAGAILVTASLLFFPMVMNSRYAAQLRGCQQNLQQIGLANCLVFKQIMSRQWVKPWRLSFVSS